MILVVRAGHVDTPGRTYYHINEKTCSNLADTANLLFPKKEPSNHTIPGIIIIHHASTSDKKEELTMMTVTENRIDDERKEDLKKYLVPYVESITERSTKAGKGQYICPLCGSGTGQHGTGAFTVYEDTNSWHCFSCGESGDIYKLVSLCEGIDSFPEQLEFVERFAGLPSSSEYVTNKKYVNKEYTQNTELTEEERQHFIRERKAYIDRCAAAAKQTDYFAKRGFTENEVRKYRLGYDSNHKGRPGIVIPYNDEKEYFTVRYIDGNPESKYDFPPNKEAGSKPLFNQKALAEDKPCFICEGQLNALSILSVASGSCNAISIGGTSGDKLLIRELKKNRPACKLIINMDPDESGQKAQESIEKALQDMNIPYKIAEFSLDKYPEVPEDPDANDLLIGNRQQLKKDIEMNVNAVAGAIDPALEAEYKEYADFIEKHSEKNALALLDVLEKEIDEGTYSEFIPTGYSNLDKELDGGLYPGLYVIGAQSSLGKTTFLLQMADQIAAAGHEVLFISMEMGAGELISKSLSRLTYQRSYEFKRNAKTVRGITTSSWYKNYTREELELIAEAKQHYKRYAGNIYIYQGEIDLGTKRIREIVENHKKTITPSGGKAPVVMIDYLQILAPFDVRATDKQANDHAIVDLKQMSRDFNIPVVAISSFNRENYDAYANPAAFKETGAIEYGTDVVMAIQPQGMARGSSYKAKAHNAKVTNNCKAKETRYIEVVVLKNRNGKTNWKAGFRYFAPYNYIEVDPNYDASRTIEESEL